MQKSFCGNGGGSLNLPELILDPDNILNRGPLKLSVAPHYFDTCPEHGLVVTQQLLRIGLAEAQEGALCPAADLCCDPEGL